MDLDKNISISFTVREAITAIQLLDALVKFDGIRAAEPASHIAKKFDNAIPEKEKESNPLDVFDTLPKNV